MSHCPLREDRDERAEEERTNPTPNPAPRAGNQNRKPLKGTEHRPSQAIRPAISCASVDFFGLRGAVERLERYAARAVGALDSILDSVDAVRAQYAKAARDADDVRTRLEATRAVCPLCAREWRAVSPVKVALLDWTQSNRTDFVIVVTTGSAQHVVHTSMTCERA